MLALNGMSSLIVSYSVCAKNIVNRSKVIMSHWQEKWTWFKWWNSVMAAIKVFIFWWPGWFWSCICIYLFLWLFFCTVFKKMWMCFWISFGFLFSPNKMSWNGWENNQHSSFPFLYNISKPDINLYSKVTFVVSFQVKTRRWGVQ